jgi:hypothetical protein
LLPDITTGPEAGGLFTIPNGLGLGGAWKLVDVYCFPNKA